MSYFVDVFVLHFIVSLHYKDTTSGHGLSSFLSIIFHFFFGTTQRWQMADGSFFKKDKNTRKEFLIIYIIKIIC